MSNALTTTPVLRVEQVSKAYGGKTVLSPTDLQVESGETVVIIGPSGSGKTTLLRCINFLEVPDTGTVTVGGKPIGRVQKAGASFRPASERELARQRGSIGFVFQRFNLFPHFSALDNVAIGLRKVRGLSKNDARERAAEELKKVSLGEHLNKRPYQLSGGQQQRVAIARAIASDPAIILFDEPTSALDPELVREVLDTIRALAERGMTLVVVTHEMSFAEQVANRVIFMADSAVVEQGPPAEIFHAPQKERTRKFLEHIAPMGTRR